MSKKKTEMTEQESKELVARTESHLRVLGVATYTVSDGAIAIFTAEFLRKLADEADRTPDKTALVFLKKA